MQRVENWILFPSILVSFFITNSSHKKVRESAKKKKHSANKVIFFLLEDEKDCTVEPWFCQLFGQHQKQQNYSYDRSVPRGQKCIQNSHPFIKPEYFTMISKHSTKFLRIFDKVHYRTFESHISYISFNLKTSYFQSHILEYN